MKNFVFFFYSFFTFSAFAQNMTNVDTILDKKSYSSNSSPNIYLISLKNPFTLVLSRCSNELKSHPISKINKNECEGATNLIPVKIFKNALRNLFDLGLFSKSIPGKDEQIETELKRINHFFKIYGQAEHMVLTAQSAERELEKLFDYLISNPKVITDRLPLDKFSFLQNILKRFDPVNNVVCGLSGSITERIKQCGSYSIKSFFLVTRKKDFTEIFYDKETELLWAGRNPKKLSYVDAAQFCKNFGHTSGITSAEWYLPTVEDFQAGESRGIRGVLKDMNYFFWTSSDSSQIIGSKKIFSGHDGAFFTEKIFDDGFNYRFYSVICLGR